MAAATVASTERPRVAGDFKVLIRSYTAVANTNTDVIPGGTGTRVLGGAVLLCSTNAAVHVTVSSQTVTFIVSAGTPDVTMAYIIA